jgi:predicted Zn-dependent protease
MAGAVLTIAAGALFLALRPYLRAWVIDVIVTRQNRSAEEYLASGDAQNALLLARRSQQRDQDNVEAWQIAARAARELDRPEALFYQENLTRIAPGKEHHLGMIRLADHFGQDAAGVEAVKRAAAVCGDEPEYHRLAAKLHVRLGQPLRAKYFLISLLSLRPDDQEAQLELARIEIEEDPAGQNQAPRLTLRRLASHPELRTRAMGPLLGDCVRTGRKEEGRTLLEDFLRQPGLTLAEQLLGLDGALAFAPARVEPALHEIQSKAAGTEAEAAQVIDFMVSHGLADAAVTWSRTLAGPVRTGETVRRAVAEALLRLREWERLRTHALEAEWPEREYLRLAVLAHAYRALGRPTEFIESWNGAVQFAGYRFRDAIDLLERVQAWRWTNERIDVLWKVFTFMPNHPDLRRDLLVWEKSRGNTANINRLLSTVLDLNPRDREAFNNYAYTTLLLDADLPRMATLTREFHAAQPDDPFGVTLMALVLMKEKQPAEALRKLETLRRTDLAHPVRMALHALLLLRSGQPERARELLPGIVTRDMLPEERQMVEQVRSGLDRLDRERSRNARLAGRDAGEVDPLARLRLPTGGPFPTELPRALGLAATGETRQLAELVRGRDWGEFNYLRLALETLAQRTANPAAARHAWDGAMLLARPDAGALDNLVRLADDWKWEEEAIDALGGWNALRPDDPERLNRLSIHFRERGRTAELARALRPWADRVPDSPEAIRFLYLSVLTGGSTSEALVQMRELAGTRGNDPDWQVAHAFILWREQRSAEAADVLARPRVRPDSSLPEGLIRALVAADLGSQAESASQLARFRDQDALPEEAELARRARNRFDFSRPQTSPKP